MHGTDGKKHGKGMQGNEWKRREGVNVRDGICRGRKRMEGNRWEEKKERERQRGMVRYETMEWGRRRESKEMEERVHLGFCSIKV